MKAGIYIRCSNEAKEKETLNVQQEACINYCKIKGWEYEVFCDDGYSGTTTNRPAFQRLLNEIRAKEIGVLVVWRQDRFSRNIIDAVTLIRKIKEVGCLYASVCENIDLSSDNGELIFNVMACIADNEVRTIKARTGENKRKHIAKGKLPSGVLPFGFRWVSEKTARLTGEDPGAYEIEEQTNTVRQIFQLFAQGHSQAEIGRQFGFDQKRVSRYLNDSSYWTGKCPTHYEGTNGTVDLPVTVIDPLTAQAVQEKLARFDNYGRPGKMWLLKSRLVCDKCGKVSEISNQPRGEKTYSYYLHQCVDGPVRVPCDEWDNLFWKRIVYAAQHPEQFQRSIKKLQDDTSDESLKTLRENRENIIREIESCKRKKNNALDRVIDSPSLKKDLVERIDELNLKLNKLNFDIKAIDAKIKNLEERKRIVNDANLVTRICELGLTEDMPFEEKQQAIKKLDTRVHFIPMVKAHHFRTATSVWLDDEVTLELVRKLKGIPVEAEGLLEIDFCANSRAL